MTDHTLIISLDEVDSTNNFLVHLVVDINYRLRYWPVFMLSCHELKFDSSILEWMMYLVIELVRILTYLT